MATTTPLYATDPVLFPRFDNSLDNALMSESRPRLVSITTTRNLTRQTRKVRSGLKKSFDRQQHFGSLEPASSLKARLIISSSSCPLNTSAPSPTANLDLAINHICSKQISSDRLALLVEISGDRLPASRAHRLTYRLNGSHPQPAPNQIITTSHQADTSPAALLAPQGTLTYPSS